MTDPGQMQGVLLFVLIQVFMIVGIVGLIIPIFPGLLIVWLAALGYGVAAGFGPVGWTAFGLITIIGLVGSLADNVLMGAGARQGGAAWSSILAGLLVGVVGTFLLPPVGGLILAPLAVLGLEYMRLKDWQAARQAVFGMAKGFGVAFVMRIIAGFIMMGLWWVWVYLG